MMTNKVLDRLKQDKPVLGGWVLTGSPVVAELLALCGFDWVCIDAEHSAVSMETALQMVTAIEKHGAEPFVRISTNSEVEIKKFLDMGVRGIIVPMIKSLEEAKSAIAGIKFPPEGRRSFALPRCNAYGLNSDEYFREANRNIFVCIMIEHVDALPELDQIFSLPAIDAVLVGPYDLSGSMGIPGKFEDPAFIEALELIYTKARENKIRMGIHEVHPTPEKISSLIDQGYRFIACGLDTLFILNEGRKYTNLH